MGTTTKFLSLASASLLAVTSNNAFAQTETTEDGASNTPINDILVTATRQSQSLSKVPVSVAAFDADSMQTIGAKQVDDLVGLTPGLQLTRTATGSNTISIRGISSSAGAGTTGVYIDDTPIQVRNLGYGSGTAFPEIFDLERVEVLRGPQGTLFGAGSEGGTVRFIQTAPNMQEWSGMVRAELATTQNGSETYEIGGAVGGPIVEDKIGFRGHVYFRHEGGYVDAVDGVATPAVTPSPIYPYSNLVDFTQTEVVRKDTNSSDALTARLAVELRPTEWLTLSPSISYQKLETNDGGGTFWIPSSDLDGRDFSRVVYRQGNPSNNPLLTQTEMPDKEEATDEFYLYALNTSIDLGRAELISSTSYFDRKSDTWFDFTQIDAFQFAFKFFVPSGYKSMSLYQVEQKNFVQELRLQSNDPSSRLNWVAGAFYSNNTQTSAQDIRNNFVAKLPVLPLYGGVAGGSPFGPGSSAIENAFGVPLIPGTNSSYNEFRDLQERQYAAFAQLDYEVIDRLKLTAGIRVSKNDLNLGAIFRGPLNNDNAPYGAPCPLGEDCKIGTGTFTPVYPDTNGFKTSETSVTPKFSVSFQADNDNLFFATAAKGFRPAGVNARVPANFCGPDLEQIGYADGLGNTSQPAVYGSDSVWSYEVGSKNRLLGGRLNLDIGAYYIKWSNIQNTVALPTCLYSFVDNLGDATSKGVDIAVNLEPVDNLQIGGTFGYNNTTYNEDVVTPAGTILSQAGSPIGGNRPWRGSLYGQYDMDPFYARVDVSHFAQAERFGNTDPDSPQYEPLLRAAPAYTTINLRAGGRVGDADVSVFVENLTNAAPILGLNDQFNKVVFTANTIRPRTIGVTLSWRR